MKNEVVIEKDVIQEAYALDNGLDQLFESLKSQVSGLVFDMDDKASREECASIAYKVSRSKTAVDDFGKDLVADAKAKIKVVDNKRKKWRESCDDLRDEIRKPLDEYEAKIKAESDRLKSNINNITMMLDVSYNSVDQVDAAICTLKALKITEEQFGAFEGDAKLAKYETLEQLEGIRAQVIENEERKKSYEASIIANATKEAEARAKAAEDRAKRAESDAIAELERQQIIKENNKNHVRSVNRGIVDALCEWGALDEDQAKDLVRKVHANQIPGLKIIY